MSPGAETDALVVALLTVPWVAQRIDPAIRASLTPPSTDWGTTPAGAGVRPPRVGPGLVLEVLGGPDDGREVDFGAPGEVLGRWAPETDACHTLYRGPGPADRSLSRSHLRYEGGRRVRALAPGTLVRGDTRTALEAAVLRPGDQLILGVTVLEVR